MSSNEEKGNNIEGDNHNIRLIQDQRDEERLSIRRRHRSAPASSDPSDDPESPVGVNEIASDDDYDDDEEPEKLDKRFAKETMAENVFSLIYTAPAGSSAFWFGIFVSLFQIAMPSLALLDLIIFSDGKNPLQVPNSVSLQVRIIGAMALILAVSQYWDFMEAVDR